MVAEPEDLQGPRVDRSLRRAMLKFMRLRRVYNIEQRLLDPPPIPEAHCDFAAKS